MNESHLAWIALNLLPLSPAARARLVEHCGGPVQVFEPSRDRLAAATPLPAETRQNLACFPWKSNAQREIQQARSRGAEILTPDSDQYPAALRALSDFPPALYVRGRLSPHDEAAVAVVGSRAASHYGLRAAEEIAGFLAGQGITIVSGLALGVDAAAHRAAIEAGGRTIAVLGCGVDVSYPRRNRELADRIAGAGAVLSEFPLGTRPEGWRFPQRNRLLAGLSLATVVVEASERSGSLITARLAMEMGRDVFAVPGPIHSPRSVGTNRLIRGLGAQLAVSGADVLAEIRPQMPPASRVPSPSGETDDARFDLPRDQQLVLAQLDDDHPLCIEDLARAARLEPGRLLDALLGLEMRGMARGLPGGRFVRIVPRAVSEAVTHYVAIS